MDDVPSEIRNAFEALRGSRRGLYIHGPVGCGKTHIAHALRKEWDDGATLRAQFWNTTELIRLMKADFDRKPKDKTRPETMILGLDQLLFLDDLGAERMSDYVADVFQTIVNDRYERMIPIIITSNLPLSALAERLGESGDRIASRLVEMCDIFELKGNDRRMEHVSKTVIMH